MEKKKQRILAKVLIAIVYCPLAAEIILLIMAPMPILPRYVCATPYGIRANEPSKSYWHRTAEYRVHIQTNSKGIRANHDIPYEKSRDLKRIVLLGDSFGMGYGVNEDQMFTARLVHYLEQDYGIKAEVVNLSTSGHGNAEELVALNHEGMRYEPDLVLVAWHPTDLSDNVRSNLYTVQEGGIQSTGKSYLPAVGLRARLFNVPGYRFLAENSQFYNFVRDLASRKISQLMLACQFNRATNTEPNDIKASEGLAADLTVFLLSEIRCVSERGGATFLVLDIPRCKNREEFFSQFPYDNRHFENTFSVLSPIETFEKMDGEMLYWERSHGHFTPLGCDLVGGRLAEYIVENKLLVDLEQ